MTEKVLVIDGVGRLIDAVLESIEPKLTIHITRDDIEQTIRGLELLHRHIEPIPFHQKLNRKPWEK